MSAALNNELMEAVTFHKVQRVKELLELGADPNYCLHPDEEEPDGIIQPTTPLRMVMFRISDNMLSDDDLIEFAAVARLLLRYGADPRPALQIAEARYGLYDPNAAHTPWMNVWHIVAKGKTT